MQHHTHATSHPQQYLIVPTLVHTRRYQVEREIRIHSTLSHPSIIQMLAAFENSKHVVLVLEW